MQFERTLKDIGGSVMVVLPADLCRYLEMKAEDTVMIQDDDGNHGKFISLWKKK